MELFPSKRKFTQLQIGQIVTCPQDNNDYEVVGLGRVDQPVVLRKVGTTNAYRPTPWKHVQFCPWKESAK